MEVMQHTGARCGPLQCPVLPTRTHLRLTTSRRCAALRKHIRVRAAEEGQWKGSSDYYSDQRYQEGSQQPPWASEGSEGREHQQHQQQAVPPGYYQGYPPYPYGPYAAPQQKSGGGIPAYVWIAVGLGIAFLVNKVRSLVSGFTGGPGNLQENMMNNFMQQAMKEAMKGGLPGQAGGSPPGFPSFPGSGFPPPPPSSPQQPAFDTTASPVAEARQRGPPSAASTPAADSTPDAFSSNRPRRRETRPRKSGFSDVGSGAGAGPADAGATGQADPGTQTGGGFSLDVMESLLKDPRMQEAMYQYLPEHMRNKETFDWMMSNPEYRKQLQAMMAKQGADLDPDMYASIKDIDADEMKKQLDAVGLTPSDILNKLMADPPLAAAFQKPNVQRAIFEARDNPLAAMRYQDDPEVMMVFEKMSQMFPQMNQGPPDFGGAPPSPLPSDRPSFPEAPGAGFGPPQSPASPASVIPPSNEQPPPTSSQPVSGNGAPAPGDFVDVAVDDSLSDKKPSGSFPTADSNANPISAVPPSPP